MSCNNKHDFPFATTVVGEVKDRVILPKNN